MPLCWCCAESSANRVSCYSMFNNLLKWAVYLLSIRSNLFGAIVLLVQDIVQNDMLESSSFYL